MQTKEVGGKILFSIFTNGLRFCWDIISIASNANIGGATSAPVCGQY